MYSDKIPFNEATTVFANGGINGKMTKHNCNFVTIFPQIPRGVERSNQYTFERRWLKHFCPFRGVTNKSVQNGLESVSN